MARSVAARPAGAHVKQCPAAASCSANSVCDECRKSHFPRASQGWERRAVWTHADGGLGAPGICASAGSIRCAVGIGKQSISEADPESLASRLFDPQQKHLVIVHQQRTGHGDDDLAGAEGFDERPRKPILECLYHVESSDVQTHTWWLCISRAFGTATTTLPAPSASKSDPAPAWLTISAASAMRSHSPGAKSKCSTCTVSRVEMTSIDGMTSVAMAMVSQHFQSEAHVRTQRHCCKNARGLI